MEVDTSPELFDESKDQHKWHKGLNEKELAHPLDLENGVLACIDCLHSCLSNKPPTTIIDNTELLNRIQVAVPMLQKLCARHDHNTQFALYEKANVEWMERNIL